MCASCDAWTAARHNPDWKPPKGRSVGLVKRVTRLKPMEVSGTRTKAAK